MHGADFYILCVHCVKSGKATGILNFYTLVAYDVRSLFEGLPFFVNLKFCRGC